MPTDITDDPSSLACDIKRSVPYDTFKCVGYTLTLTRGEAIMVVNCPPNADAVAWVDSGPGAKLRRITANDTDTITRAWPNA